MPASKKVVHRSAVDGQFVTKKFADKNPRETERETVRVPTPAGPAKKRSK